MPPARTEQQKTTAESITPGARNLFDNEFRPLAAISGRAFQPNLIEKDDFVPGELYAFRREENAVRLVVTNGTDDRQAIYTVSPGEDDLIVTVTKKNGDVVVGSVRFLDNISWVEGFSVIGDPEITFRKTTHRLLSNGKLTRTTEIYDGLKWRAAGFQSLTPAPMPVILSDGSIRTN